MTKTYTVEIKTTFRMQMDDGMTQELMNELLRADELGHLQRVLNPRGVALFAKFKGQPDEFFFAALRGGLREGMKELIKEGAQSDCTKSDRVETRVRFTPKKIQEAAAE